MKRAVRKVGTAVTVSGLVTAAGFSELMLSSFPILSGFGLATVIVVILSLISAVVVMPATLVLPAGSERKNLLLKTQNFESLLFPMFSPGGPPNIG
jgi:predicted RND superfamily exporter protein